MLRFSCIISNQIRFLLESVNDSNFDSTYRELIQFVEYGNETSSLLLQFCLDHVNYQGRDIQNYQLKQDLLSATFRYILDGPNFCTIFCEALGATTMSEGFLVDLSNILNLSAAEKTGIGLALSESETQDFRMKGQNFSIAQIEDLCANPNPEISNKQIQEVLLFIYRSEGLSKHVDSFTKILSLILFKANAFFGETPMLSDDIRDVASLTQMDLFSEFFDNDFESVLEEIEKEISMADIVRELGYRCTANVSRCIEMLSLFLPLSEMTLSKLLGVMARSHFLLNDTQNMHSAFCSALNYNSSCGSPLLSSWNVDVLVDAIMQLAPTTNWISVMENLDHEGFSIPDEQSFTLLMSIYARASQDPFPLHVFCGSVWKNEEGQLSFLRHAISAQPDIFTLMHCSRQLAHADSANLSKSNENQAWSCPDLLNVLCQLSEKGYVNSVRLMLEQPLNQCPEVLLVGIAHINTPYNLLQYEVLSTVFPILLRDPTKSGTIHHLWRVNPEMVLRGFIDTHTDSNNLFRILDICQELKILSSVLDVTPFPVSIRLAAVAFRMEHLMLEEWLLKNLKIYEVAFFENCFNFLKEIISELDKDVPNISLRQCTETIRNVYQETYLVFLKVLEAHYGNLSSLQSSEKLKAFTIFCNSKSQSSMSANMSASSVSSYDIKAEANAFIHHMFSGQLTIDDSVHRLACFRESSGTREHLIFDCIVANIIEEYKVFPTYPDRQLTLAAVLFGSLIKHRLLTDFQLSIALHGVLDSLHKSVDSKMFLFGTKALEQFTERLVEWPYYCNQILQISHLHGEHAGLVSVVEHALAQRRSSHADSTAEKSLPSDQQLGCSSPTLESMEASSSLSLQALTWQSTNAHVAVSLSSPFLGSSCNAKSAGFGFALNVETFVMAAEGRAHIENPASDVQDKILFMINNISSANIDSKAVEFTTILTEQYYPWFAEYLVMKRVSIEPNLQHMYLKFLEKVNSRSLNNEIVKATYENCKVLLRSERIKSSSEERSLLKNLGRWLGKFTIGRNRALLAKEIDPKVLIIEAYEKGLMIAVIPFTSKILETCQSSMAYRPPNPWTMGILGLLSEIYHLPNLKMNLKFDIEVLFKNLTLDMKSVSPTSLLKERACEVEGNPDFSNKDIGISRALVKTPTISHINPQSKYAASALISSITVVEDEKTRDLIALEHVHSAKGLTQFTASPASSQTLNQLLNCIIDGDSHINRNSAGESLLQLDRIFQGAVNSAIREVEPHVTRCSVAVASQTTKELVLKDYAMEIDVSKSTRAACLMVDNLAGNLTYALCTEHLRLALSNYIQNLLQILNFDSERMEQTVQSLTTKYLPLGCEGIRTIASEKAINLINEQIVLAFASVKRHQEATSSFHNDVGTYSHSRLVCIPEVLHPRPGRMTIAQEQVYDGFIGNIWQSTCGNSSSILPACPAGLDGIMVTRPLDLIDEETDGLAQHSCRTSNLGPTDDVIHSVPGSKSFAPFHANVKSNELNDASRLANICTVLDVGALSSPALSPGMEDALSQTSISSGEEVIFLFNAWYHICELPATNATAYTRFISQLHQRGFLKGDDITYWFFHFLLVQSADSLSIQTSNYRDLQLEPIDAFAKLVVLVLKHTSSVPGSIEVVFLAKVLSMTTSLILEDAEKKKAFFNPRLYSRLFVNWFLGLVSSDPLPDAANFQVLTSFANAFHTLQPVKVPSFSFAWLELVCHTFHAKASGYQSLKQLANFPAAAS